MTKGIEIIDRISFLWLASTNTLDKHLLQNIKLGPDNRAIIYKASYEVPIAQHNILTCSYLGNIPPCCGSCPRVVPVLRRCVRCEMWHRVSADPLTTTPPSPPVPIHCGQKYGTLHYCTLNMDVNGEPIWCNYGTQSWHKLGIWHNDKYKWNMKFISFFI